MGEEVVVDITANDKATPAWKIQADAVHSYLQELAKLDAVQKANERAAKDYDRAAQKVIDDCLTPQERYNKKVAELRELLDKNKLSQNEYARAVKRASDELGKLDAAQQANERSAAEFEQAAKRAIEEGLTPLEKYNRRVAELQVLLDKGKLSQEQFNRAVERSRDDFQQLDPAHRANTRALEEYQRAARRVIEDGLTPQDRYNRKVSELKGLLDRNLISQTQFNGAVTKANAEMQGANKWTSYFDNMQGSLLGVAAGFLSVQNIASTVNQIFEEMSRKNLEFSKKSEGDAKSMEERLLRYRAQAGLDELEGEKSKESIQNIANQTAMKSSAAFSMATALVSTGVESNVAQGEGLLPLAKLMKAQALDPNKSVSEGEMAESFTKFLSATGQEKSGANIEKLAVAVQGLKATPLKVTDLGQLAKHASGVKELGRLSPEEMLSNFAFLTQTEESEEAGTHIREVVRQLATAGGNKKAVQQLKEMGLDPKDVDFVGESFNTVLARVQKGIDKLPEEKRAQALDTLVEGRNIAAFSKLAKGQGEVANLRQLMTDKEGFEKDFEMTSTGRNAAAIRQENQREEKAAARQDYSELYWNAIERYEREQGSSQYKIDDRKKDYESNIGYGFAPERSAKSTVQHMWTDPSHYIPMDRATRNKQLREIEDFAAEAAGGKENLQRMREEHLAQIAANSSADQSQQVSPDAMTELNRNFNFTNASGPIAFKAKQKSKTADEWKQKIDAEASTLESKDPEGNAKVIDELRSLSRILERSVEIQAKQARDYEERSKKPQKVEVTGGKFTPRTDPTPAGSRPAAGLGG